MDIASRFKDFFKKKSSAASGADVTENENKKRELTGKWKTLMSVICAAMALFQLYAAGSGLVDDSIVVSVHLAFVLCIIFLLFPATSKSPKHAPGTLDLLFAVVGFCVALYVAVFAAKINRQMGQATSVDIICGGIAILLVLEAARRAIGKALPIVSICFMLFAYFGRHVPAPFTHMGYSPKNIIKLLYLTDEGLFGTALNTSATFVILFIFFGAIMSEIGMSQFLNDFALAVAGSSKGGPAKVSALASGLMGTVSGSTSANVATTGVMTIPLMKSVGYIPEYAGAVECVALAGGQIMPPVMGAAAFLMAQFLGVQYSVIVIAAVIPAVLYYICVWASVDLRARNKNLKTISKDQIPSFMTTIKKYGYMGIPLLALIYFLTIKKYNPIYAAWLAILLAIAVSFLKPQSRLTVKRFIKALESGVKATLSVAIACACAGIVIGIISLTGFGLVFSMNIFKLSMGIEFLALIFGMVASIILGMGLPTTACYIVTGLTIAPALVNMGINPLAAHFFVFYFAIMSTITPPVALSSFVAAGLAQSDPVKTGITAFRLAIAGFLIPFMLVYKPELLIVDSNPLTIVYSFAIAIVGIVMLAAANEGYFWGKLGPVQRLALATSVIGLLLLDWKGDIIAIPVIVVVLLTQKRRQARAAIQA